MMIQYRNLLRDGEMIAQVRDGMARRRAVRNCPVRISGNPGTRPASDRSISVGSNFH